MQAGASKSLPTSRTQARQLTCPLENTNTRAAPAAVIPQVKKVPSKAWNTALWPWSMLDIVVCRQANSQPPGIPFGDTCMFSCVLIPLSKLSPQGVLACTLLSHQPKGPQQPSTQVKLLHPSPPGTERYLTLKSNMGSCREPHKTLQH